MRANALLASFGVVALIIGGVASAAPHQLHYLTAQELSAASVLPPPPAPGSIQEKAELKALHAIVEASSPARLDQARWDQDHEDPALFDKTLGIELQKLPLTWALLSEVREEAGAAVAMSKAYFHRARPWGVDPTLASCERAPEHKPINSYPSGHAILGYSAGYVLAQLLPGRATEIVGRAADYGYSREVCGVHFASDIEASHALGTLLGAKLLANAAFKAKFDAARQELIDAHIAGA
ncbi:MAG: phosphoesterase [Sphingomonas sp. 28-66-16]|nr:MAG: phosphoesterase [Sphingomonas sp. 28-66-16]